MKRTFSQILVALLLVVCISHAQPYWKPIGGGAIGRVQGITLTSDGSIFLVSQYRGMHKYYATGASWQRDTVSNSFYQAYDIICDNKDNLYTVIDKNFIGYRSSNLGETWEPIGKNLGYPIATDIDVTTSGDLYIATNRKSVFRSTDLGESWMSLGLDELLYAYLSLSVDIDGNIYASNGVRFFRSTDKGTSWTEHSDVFSGYSIISISCVESGNVYVGTYGPDGAIFRSSDRGESWTVLHVFNPDVRTVGVVEMPNGDIIAASDNYIIWRSTDGGQNWTLFYEGFQQTGATCIYMSRDHRVFAGVYGGIYELMDYPTSASQPSAPASLALSQSYPNPVAAGQRAYINFSLPTEQHITLSAYNTAGEKVATIAEGTYSPGVHTATFAASSSLPSGVYIYRLTAGASQQSKLMQVVR